MAKSLPTFTKIAEIVGHTEESQDNYGPSVINEELHDMAVRGEDTYATGFKSKLTRGGRPWHLENPNAGPNPGDYASMDPAHMSAEQLAQKELLENFRKAPRHATRAIVAARAYEGAPARAWSEHPLLESAPAPALSPEDLYLRWIGHRVTWLMERAGTLRIKHSFAADQKGEDSLAARWYEWRMNQREKAAESIGDYLVGKWRSKL